MRFAKIWVSLTALALAAAVSTAPIIYHKFHPPVHRARILGDSSNFGPLGTRINPFFVSSFAQSSTATIARPANTTTYTVNTAWSSAVSSCNSAACYLTFQNVCAYAGENVMVIELDVYSNVNPTLKLTGSLWLLNVVPGTILQDNAAFTIASADYANLTGGSFSGISFALTNNQSSGAANSGTSLTGSTLGSPIVATCGTSTSLFGLIEVSNAYVPASGEILTAKLKTIAAN